MKHIRRFTSPAIVGEVITGISEGRTTNGRLRYSTTWSGIYDGIQTSEWDGQPIHAFHDGIIGKTPQRAFAIPVSQFICGDHDCAHPLTEHDENGCAHKLPREDWFDNDDTESDNIYCPCTAPYGKVAS